MITEESVSSAMARRKKWLTLAVSNSQLKCEVTTHNRKSPSSQRLTVVFSGPATSQRAAEILFDGSTVPNILLGSYTSSGRLYETDLRLRPNGASGLLVSSIASFAETAITRASSSGRLATRNRAYKAARTAFPSWRGFRRSFTGSIPRDW